MTLGEFIDDTFKIAVGWLGWTPEQALHTPIPQIMLALEGRIDWRRKISGIPDLASQERASTTDVASRLRAVFGARAKGKHG